MVNFTLDELADFSRFEEKLIKEVMGTENKTPLLCPRKNVINNILSYSKALSVRDSKYLKHSSIVLN